MNIDIDFYIEMLEKRYNEVADRWGHHDALFEQFCEMIRSCDGVNGDPNPSVVVDNFIINGEFTTKEDWQTEYPSMYDYYDGDFKRFAEREGVLYTWDEVCLRC